jgi:predicted DNA-binding transcriptional regulator YafY
VDHHVDHGRTPSGQILAGSSGRLFDLADPTSRMLRLLSLLQTHRHWPGTELADRLEVSERTLRRDIDRLRELGYPVDATRGTDGGYQLAAGSQLPPLLLDDDEAVAIAVGLRAAAGNSVDGIEETSVRALAKLEQVLPARLRSRIGALQQFSEPMTWGGPNLPTIDPSDLTEIAGACRDAVRLRFDYERRDGEFGGRMVEPHRLVSAGRRWYLVAWDVDRDDWRTFRVDRMVEPKALTRPFTPRELPDGVDAAAFVAAGIQTMNTTIEARLTVQATPEELAEQRIMADRDVEAIDATSSRLRLRAEHVEWLAIVVASLPFPVEVHEPPELVDAVRAMSQRLVAAVGA